MYEKLHFHVQNFDTDTGSINLIINSIFTSGVFNHNPAQNCSAGVMVDMQFGHLILLFSQHEKYCFD